MKVGLSWRINLWITCKKPDPNRTFFMDFGTFSKFDEKWDFWTSMRKYAWSGWVHGKDCARASRKSWQISSNFIRKTLQNPWKMSDLGPVFCMWFANWSPNNIQMSQSHSNHPSVRFTNRPPVICHGVQATNIESHDFTSFKCCYFAQFVLTYLFTERSIPIELTDTF